jgi:hypothetical protein
LRLSYSIVKESGKQTYHTKKDTALNLFNSVKSFTKKSYSASKRKVDRYRTEGFQNELSNDYYESLNYAKEVPDKLILLGKNVKDKAIYFNDNFIKKTKNEKIELISVGIIGILIFFAAAGGEDLEGGVPDSDLNLGVVFHRHFYRNSKQNIL